MRSLTFFADRLEINGIDYSNSANVESQKEESTMPKTNEISDGSLWLSPREDNNVAEVLCVRFSNVARGTLVYHNRYDQTGTLIQRNANIPPKSFVERYVSFASLGLVPGAIWLGLLSKTEYAITKVSAQNVTRTGIDPTNIVTHNVVFTASIAHLLEMFTFSGRYQKSEAEEKPDVRVTYSPKLANMRGFTNEGVFIDEMTDPEFNPPMITIPNIGSLWTPKREGFAKDVIIRQREAFDNSANDVFYRGVNESTSGSALIEWFLDHYEPKRAAKPLTPKTQFIGITGLARSGKDEAGMRIVDRLRNGKKGFPAKSDWATASFAAPIKKMLNSIGVSISDDMKNTVVDWLGITPRKLMQTLGTEWGRNLEPDIWVNYFDKEYQGTKRVVTDIRMENEAEYIRKHGVLIHLTGRGGLTGEEGQHSSEQGLPFKEGDLVLDNSRDLVWLQSQIDCLDLTRVFEG